MFTGQRPGRKDAGQAEMWNCCGLQSEMTVWPAALLDALVFTALSGLDRHVFTPPHQKLPLL